MTEYHPFLPGAVLLFPLLGFVLNGVLALSAGIRGANEVRRRGTSSRGGAQGATHDGADQGAHGGAQIESAEPLAATLPSWIGPGVIGAAFVLVLVNFFAMAGGDLEEPTIVGYWVWMATGGVTIDVALHLDQLSMIMMTVITGVGFLIHLFSVGYMREDPGYARYFAYLNLFVFFMLLLVMGASFPLMFVGWEGVGLCSYLLIGFWFRDREKADAGKKAFIVNRIGDFGFLVAIFLIFVHLGAIDYVGVFESAPDGLEYGGAAVTAIALFLLLGAVGKSAQIPLFVWLPDAMAGPTPVSALIHAATMVTAGVYLVARSSVLFALAPVGAAVVATIGATTALFAATIALQQYDIKKVLAYSTVSQLGFMFLGVGAGAYVAGVFHLMTHAFFKGLLFLGAGAVIHSMHHALHHTHSEWDAQDMRNMGGLRRHMPITWVTMGIATLAIAGIWPFAGFFSKDEIIWYAGAAGTGEYRTLFTVLWGMALAAALLTAIYMTRMMVMTFHGPNRTGEKEAEHLHEAPLVMTIPLAILALFSLIGGWVNVPESVRESAFGGFGLLPMSDWLERWLEPVTHAAHDLRLEHLGEYASVAPTGGGHVAWGAITMGIALTGVVVTFLLVSRARVRPAIESLAPAGFLRRALYRKWYVDELYDIAVLRPLIGASRFAWRVVDAVLIDGTVKVVGGTTRAFGWFGSLVQTGRVTTYAFVLTIGALAILGVLVL